jgi:MYXO-CTERM domain-containing protein
MSLHALRPRRLLLATAVLVPVLIGPASAAVGPAPAVVAKSLPATPALLAAARAGLGAWPTSTDELLGEIQTHFHGARKWFGMVSDMQLDRAIDGTVTPRFEMLQSKFVLRHDAAGQTLRARLPQLADAAHVVEFDGVDGFSVRTKEIGIQSVPAEIHEGVVVYRGAVAGGDLLYKLTPTHVDEYVYLREPPAHLRREFEFDTGSAVWTLREADTNIEALGKDGIARLRLSAPLARAADGQRRRGTVHISGRTIVLDIDLTGLAAPILVDPDWSTTGTMTVSHWGDAAWRRPDGRVMAVGGCALTGCPTNFTNTACGQVLANSDLWDPASGTWTSAAAMLTARTTFAGVPFPSGDMMVAGGCTATGCTQMNDAGLCEAQPCTQATNLAEIYSYATGAWIAAGALSSPRYASMGVPLGANGDALIAGGCDAPASGGADLPCTSSVERWSAATKTWSEQAPLPAPRGFGTATVLADGRVLVVGGCADPLCTTVLGDAAVYDPVANSWAAAGTMSSPRAGHTATLLNDGTVLVAGGCTDATCTTALKTVDIWSASGGLDGGTDGGVGSQFVAGPPMAGAKHHHTASLLRNGEVLMAGGADSTGSSVPTSEVYLPVAHQWIGTSALFMSRAFHIGVPLSDGRVLVSGGCNPQTCIPFAEVFSPANLPVDSDAGVDAGLEIVDAGSDAGSVDAGVPPPPTSPHPAVYRTGVTKTTCATDTTQDLMCPVAGWPFQDSDFQPNAQALAKTADDEVTDKTTGLVWQRGDDGNTYTYADAAKHCSTFTSAEASTGWRLPSVVELMTLIDSGVDLPSIDPSFTGAQSNNYWTSTPTAIASMLSWTVKFDFGEVIPLLTDSTLPVRCVRGKSDILNVGSSGLRKAGPLKALTDTVQDATTNLEWQRADDGTRRNWKDSLNYCANLSLGGLSGWHLPNVSELTSLVQFDAVTNGVAIDSAFTNPKGDLYWTSTQNEGIPSLSWTVTFNLGVVDGISVSGIGYDRCVRHMGPASSSGCGCNVPGESGGVKGVLAASALLALAILRRRRSRARARKAAQSQ